jgi:hypothetical protein
MLICNGKRFAQNEFAKATKHVIVHLNYGSWFEFEYSESGEMTWLYSRSLGT